MNRVVFDTVPELVQQTQEGVTAGEFDISAPILGAAAVEGLYGVRGYVELAQVGVPVERSSEGMKCVNFHVFGVPEGAPFLEDATPNAMSDGKAEALLPAGTVAVIDSTSLAELSGRAGMSRKRLAAYEVSLAEAQMHGSIVPSVTTAHAISGTKYTAVRVGRGAAFAPVLERGEDPLASRSHFTVAIDGMRYAAALRVHASNGTRVTRMR